MENKLKCIPIMLPTEEKYFDMPIIWYATKSLRMLYFDKFMSRANKELGYKPQQLYLVSDREIKVGDYLILEDKVKKAYTDLKDILPAIIATTDHSLGLPLIPESFIKKWISSQGKIESVFLELEDHFEHMGTDVAGKSLQLKLTKNDEVIILPTKDSFSREEVKQIISEFRKSEVAEFWKNEVDIKEWLDKNY